MIQRTMHQQLPPMDCPSCGTPRVMALLTTRELSGTRYFKVLAVCGECGDEEQAMRIPAPPTPTAPRTYPPGDHRSALPTYQGQRIDPR